MFSDTVRALSWFVIVSNMSENSRSMFPVVDTIRQKWKPSTPPPAEARDDRLVLEGVCECKRPKASWFSPSLLTSLSCPNLHSEPKMVHRCFSHAPIHAKPAYSSSKLAWSSFWVLAFSLTTRTTSSSVPFGMRPWASLLTATYSGDAVRSRLML